MSFRATILKRCCSAVFLLGLIAHAFADDQPIPTVAFDTHNPITVTFLPAPSLGGGGDASSSSTPAKWLKVEFHYSVTPDKNDFLDSIEFKIWIEGRDVLAPDAPGNEGITVVLTGSVTYILVPKSKDAYGSFYVHPSVLSRYHGIGRDEDFGNKWNIHIEAYVGGSKVDVTDKKREDDPNWFTATGIQAVSGLVSRQDQCPFLVSAPDRYPMIKPQSSAQ